MVILGEVRLTPSGPIHLTRSGKSFQKKDDGSYHDWFKCKSLCGKHEEMITYNHDNLTDSVENTKYCPRCLKVANDGNTRILKKPGSNDEQFVSPKSHQSNEKMVR